MREKYIESKLRDKVKQRGGRAVKFVSPGYNGMPDRILLLPGGRIAFAEVKAPGKKPTPLQEKRARELRELGFTVYVVDSVEAVQQLVGEVMPDEVYALYLSDLRDK